MLPDPENAPHVLPEHDPAWGIRAKYGVPHRQPRPLHGTGALRLDTDCRT